MRRSTTPLPALLLIAAIASALGGCQTAAGARAGTTSAPSGAAGASRPSSTPAAPSPAAQAAADSPALLFEGRPVRWSQLRPLLIEAAGGEVLADWVLLRRIERELTRRGKRLTEEMIESERLLMLSQLSDNADEAFRLLERVRESRNLGPARFDLLLRRNAGLRAIIADQVNVTDAMLRDEYEMRHGVKTQVRMILVANLNDASAVMRRLEAGEPFDALAAEVSTDISRTQGGLLPPISAQDTSFPAAIREAAVRLVVGQTSQPITLEQGFAILRCERKVPAEGVDFASVEADLRREVRLGAERLLMERQARTLMAEVDVTVLDADLDRVWRRQLQSITTP